MKDAPGLDQEAMETAPRAMPPAPYIGGKRLLAKRLIERIEATPHRCYAEPFVGMGGVFFRRRLRPAAEVINDLNGEVANLFRILQRHYAFFIDFMRFGLTSRREFERLTQTAPATLTDLERAARFLYLQRTAFGGKVTGQTFGVSPYEPGPFNVLRLASYLEAVHERLAGVVIESLPYAEFIARYDRPETLFYLDPPYCGSEHYYGRGMFSREEFEQMAALLAKLKGNFILSLNDVEDVRRVFSDFGVERVETVYSVHDKKPGKKAGEVIITRRGKPSTPGT
jgi:DNA adenine methylase